MDYHIRPLASLDHDAIVQLARDRADAGEPLRPHGFVGKDTHTFEHAYHARQIELRAEVEG